MSERTVNYWLDLADYDLETAETLYKGGRWLYVAFMCHQVIEKTLKAFWSAVHDDSPPYIHNHKRLATGCGLYDKMSDEQRDFIETITNFNIEARYPEDKEELSRMLTKQACRKMIDETDALQQWIKKQLSAETKLSNSSNNTNK